MTANYYHSRPDGVKLAIEKTDRVENDSGEIILIPATDFSRMLEWLRANHPHLVLPTAVAGLAGVRSDEIHGKRSAKGVARATMKRQRWRDIFINNETMPYLRVTVAKKNTRSFRKVPLCPALVGWLKLAYVDRKRPDPDSYLCDAGAMEQVRELILAEKLAPLRKNVFRKTFISNELERTDDVPATSIVAGTAVQGVERTGGVNPARHLL